MALGLPLAVLAGTILPVQGRINGGLAQRLDDSIAAALISFGTGLALLLVLIIALPAGRAAEREFTPALRERRFPPWYISAGAMGAYFVIAQAISVGPIGIALFTVAVVAGQTLSGLLADRIGFGPAGRRPVTAARVIGAALTLVSVAWAVSPRFGHRAGGAGLVLLVLLPFIGGLLQSFQQAMNGTMTVAYRSPLAATVQNFGIGTAALLLVWAVKLALFGAGLPLPPQWWFYIAGPLGALFIASVAVLVRILGVLLMGLGVVAGQLIGSLVLDLVVPTPGTVVEPVTVLGTLLTLVAIVIATLPWPRQTVPGKGRR